MDAERQPNRNNPAFGRLEGGEAPRQLAEESDTPMALTEPDPKTTQLMEQVVQKANLRRALKRVRANKGSPGVDGMNVDELVPYLRVHWEELKRKLLDGSYEPSAVKRVEIPKPSGGVRSLGIPTVLDRFIQQAILQALTPLFDPSFSPYSYGFRPGKSAHQAVEAARAHIQEGYGWVVDMDLEKFFDRVNHDVLMGRLAKRIADKRLLKIIRRYLQAGIMVDGVTTDRHEGTPQGGPLSPLLSNVLLDELDKELEARGHRFVRYADDCNVYVRSKRAGERVLSSLKEWLAKRLRLRVNEKKSAVDRPQKRKFLGFSFFKRDGRVKIGIASESIRRIRERIRWTTRRGRGMALERVIAELNRFTVGWIGYFQITEAPSALKAIDEWTRRRLRCFRIKQWKNRPRTRYREMHSLGLSEKNAAMFASIRRGWWVLSMTPQTSLAFPESYFVERGLIGLLRRHAKLQSVRTAGCGPACPVV